MRSMVRVGMMLGLLAACLEMTLDIGFSRLFSNCQPYTPMGLKQLVSVKKYLIMNIADKEFYC